MINDETMAKLRQLEELIMKAEDLGQEINQELLIEDDGAHEIFDGIQMDIESINAELDNFLEEHSREAVTT